MRPIDADYLENMGYELHRTYQQDANTMVYEVKKIADVPTIEAEPKWIPCSEKLPAPRAESYWVCTDGAYQHECRWTNINPFWTDRTTEWHWNLFDTPPHSEVIAWMPLPEPYCGSKMEGQEV